MRRTNFLDLFSGIGGFAFGATLAGLEFENHFFSEIEPYAIQVYQKNFPEAKALGDISNIDCERLTAEHGTDWFICGGFPCQNVSDLGKKAGIGGAKSSLWFAKIGRAHV